MKLVCTHIGVEGSTPLQTPVTNGHSKLAGSPKTSVRYYLPTDAI